MTLSNKTIEDHCSAIHNWADQFGINLPEMSEDMTELSPLALPVISESNKEITYIPEAISHLTWLEILCLPENKIEIIPDSLFDLPNLVHLNLCGNSITTLPESVGNAKALTSLRLGDNQISSIPESIGNCSELSMLVLFNNPIAQLPNSLEQCDKLTFVNINDTNIDPQNTIKLPDNNKHSFVKKNEIKKSSEANDNAQVKGVIPISEIMSDVFAKIDNPSNAGGITGIKSGFIQLDEQTTGFHPGQLIFVAGCSGVGKTAFAHNLAANTSLRVKYPRPIALFSLQLSKEEMVLRLLTSEAKVDTNSVRLGYVGCHDKARLSTTADNLRQTPLFIDDTRRITPEELREKCIKIKAQHGDLGLIIIDTFQLMDTTEKFSAKKKNEHIACKLKEIALELSVPIFAMITSNPPSGWRNIRILSSHSELRGIEHSADIILIIHRESVYMENFDERFEAASKMGEFIVAKHSNGSKGSIPVLWTEQYTRFDTIDTDIAACAEWF